MSNNRDRIVVIDKGKIIGDNNYDALIKECKFFKDLVARQRVDVDDDE